MIHTAPGHGTKFDDSVLDTDRIGGLLNLAHGLADKLDINAHDIAFVAEELSRWVVFAELSKLAGGGIPFLDFTDIVDSVSRYTFGVELLVADAAVERDDLLEIVAELARDEFRIDTDGTYIA